MKRDFRYQCDYCHTRFKTEPGFMRHHCDEMTRLEQFKSLQGQAAQQFYKAWMFKKHHTMNVTPEAFRDSSYFAAFYKFVGFVKNTQLPDPDSFIALMVKQKIEPRFWIRDEAYAKYLEWITRAMPTEKLIEITIQTIFDIADVTEVSPGEVFTIISPNEIIQLLQQRRISPWILLNSKKFTIFFRDSTTGEERIILETLINPDYWMKRFESHPDDLKLAKECVSALEL